METKKNLYDWYGISKDIRSTEIHLPFKNSHNGGSDPVTNPGPGVVVPEPVKALYILLFIFVLLFRRKR